MPDYWTDTRLSGFVGTASIGTDHLDIPWLVKASGIKWAHAHQAATPIPRPSTTLAMFWLACQRLGYYEPAGLSVGNHRPGKCRLPSSETAGPHLAATTCSPTTRHWPIAGKHGLVSLDEALAQDVVCLHVPLTREGPYPTWRFIDQRALALLPDGAMLLNSARGGDVVDGDALLPELLSGHACRPHWMFGPENP